MENQIETDEQKTVLGKVYNKSLNSTVLILDEMPNINDQAILWDSISKGKIKKGDVPHIFQFDEDCASRSGEYDFKKVKIL